MKKQTPEEMQITLKAARNAFCALEIALVVWIVVVLIGTGELLSIPFYILIAGVIVFCTSTIVLRNKNKK